MVLVLAMEKTVATLSDFGTGASSADETAADVRRAETGAGDTERLRSNPYIDVEGRRLERLVTAATSSSVGVIVGVDT